MIGRAVIVTLAASACAQTVSATTLPPVELATLFRDADVVATVTVLSGEVVTNAAGELCGAKYSAKVEEAFKGSAKSQTLEFGNYLGYEVGSRYVVFLTAPGHRYEPMMSANSFSMKAKAENEKACGALLERNTVMHSGYGALPVRWSSEFKYKDGVRIAGRYVVLPPGAKTVAAKPVSESEEYSEVVWVQIEEMNRLLQELGR